MCRRVRCVYDFVKYVYKRELFFSIEMPETGDKDRRTRKPKKIQPSTVTQHKGGKLTHTKKNNKREKHVSHRTRIPFDFVKKANELKAVIPDKVKTIEKIMFPVFCAQEKNLENFYYHHYVKAEKDDPDDCFVVTRAMNHKEKEYIEHEMEEKAQDKDRIIVESGFYKVGLLEAVLNYAKSQKKRVTIDPVGLGIRATKGMTGRSMQSNAVTKLEGLIAAHAEFIDVCFERLVETLYLAHNPKHFSEDRNHAYRKLLVHIYREVARHYHGEIHVRSMDEKTFTDHKGILEDLHSILENVHNECTIVFWDYVKPVRGDVMHFLPDRLKTIEPGMLARIPLNARRIPGKHKDRSEKEHLKGGAYLAYESYGYQKANAIPIEPLGEQS